jgi:cytochrome c oxidase subunit 2
MSASSSNILRRDDPSITPQGAFCMKLGTILIAGISFAALAVCAAPRPPRPPKTINITAARFAFDPNEITVNKGEAVTLIIRSKDVSHGLVIEGLGVRTEIKKGQSASVTFTPDTVGTFEGK